MITITTLPQALVPVDSDAARRVSAPNYDEFQGDREIWQAIRENPESVLKVTMAHCDAPSFDAVGPGDSEASLRRADANMEMLRRSPLTREVSDLLFVYEIVDAREPNARQVGLGGLARTDEIRTDLRPHAPIIRNEGVREAKARGRARLVQATNAILGTVSLAVPDDRRRVATTLEAYAADHAPSFETSDRHGHEHRIWLVEDAPELDACRRLLAEEPEAYVADGNHRSAAAAMLELDHFLAVFFPAEQMRISPYNRLVRGPIPTLTDLPKALSTHFEMDGSEVEPIQPRATHEVGLYSVDEGWLRLRPRPSSFDPDDPTRAIDHDIVQRNLFEGLLGLPGPTDERLIFVGGDRDARWLQTQVDRGEAIYAVTLPAVTMAQFVAVCRKNGMMPPKSTWFEPKIRSGLVMALLD